MTDNVPVVDEASTETNLADLLRKLSSSQMRFVAKRVWTDTDAEAAREMGISASTVKNWKQDGAPLDATVRLMKEDGVIVAAEMLRRALVDAVTVKVEGLMERNPGIRQSVATEIIERNLGRPVQRNEVSGSIQVVVNDLGPFGD